MELAKDGSRRSEGTDFVLFVMPIWLASVAKETGNEPT